MIEFYISWYKSDNYIIIIHMHDDVSSMYLNVMRVMA